MAQPDDIDSIWVGTAQSTLSCTSSTLLRLVATHLLKSTWHERFGRTKANGKHADATNDNSPTSSFGTCGTTPNGTPRPHPPTARRRLNKIHLTRELRERERPDPSGGEGPRALPH